MSTGNNIPELELYLVRHGCSMTNAGAPVFTAEEKCDPVLTEAGEIQAELLGRRFAALPLDCVISSGLRRAEKTAAAVIRHQPGNGAKKLEINPLFTEWGISEEYPGKTIDEIKAEFPCACVSPGAEGYERLIEHYTDGRDDIMEKTAAALAYLRNRFKNGEKVLVAGHGKFNGFLIYSALGLKEDEGFRLSLYNTGVTKLIFYKKGTGIEQDVGLVYLNDHSHLYSDFPDFSFTKV